MTVRSLATAALGAAIVAIVPSANAGVVMGEVYRMDAGAGLLDLDHPVPDPFTDLASIDGPDVGSFLLVEASVPDVSAFRSELEFASISGPDAVFSFSNEGYLAPWELGEYEFGFVANRLVFSSSGGVFVTLTGTLGTMGTGYGFFDVGGDIADLVTFGPSTVSYSAALGPGVQTILGLAHRQRRRFCGVLRHGDAHARARSGQSRAVSRRGSGDTRTAPGVTRVTA